MKSGQFLIRNSKNIKKNITERTAAESILLEDSINRLRLYHFYSSLKNDNSYIAKETLREINMNSNLSYINRISSSPAPQLKPHNLSDDLNKRFLLNKIEQTKDSKRIGLLGYKVGMTGTWDKFGTWFPLTVLKIDRCQVTYVKTDEKDNYFAIQLGAGEKDPQNTNHPMLGHFIKHKVPPKRDLKEFKVTPDCLLPIGYILGPRHFIPGQYVDVVGTSKGKGWQGVMKRWNFAGGVASHGNSKKHRSAGSIGNREKPGRVFKGKRMAGQLGDSKKTVQNLLVFKIDHTRSLLYLKGSIPGNTNSLVLIYDSKKKHEIQFKNLPYPTSITENGKEYQDIIEFVQTEDLNEKYDHDNDEVLGVSDEEEGAPDTSKEGMEEMKTSAGDAQASAATGQNK